MVVECNGARCATAGGAVGEGFVAARSPAVGLSRLGLCRRSTALLISVVNITRLL